MSPDLLEFDVLHPPQDHASAISLLKEQYVFAPESFEFDREYLERAAAQLRVSKSWVFGGIENTSASDPGCVITAMTGHHIAPVCLECELTRTRASWIFANSAPTGRHPPAAREQLPPVSA